MLTIAELSNLIAAPMILQGEPKNLIAEPMYLVGELEFSEFFKNFLIVYRLGLTNRNSE